MDIKSVSAIYFSPTGGTRRYVVEIAKRIKRDFVEIDLTNVYNREKKYIFGEDDLVILGSPVYFGRIPQIKGGIFDNIKGNNTKTIFTVTYGNRDYEDALLEQMNICSKNGFIGVAAAALVAPHSYSQKIAHGHPNNKDLFALDVFVNRVKDVIEREAYENKSLIVKGKYPYRKYSSVPFSPSANKKCNKCGKCAERCPVSAINVTNPEKKPNSNCISCLACVKYCPHNVRTVKNPLLYIARFMLERKLTKEERIPEFFYVDKKPV